jgi:deoxyribonuclease V
VGSLRWPESRTALLAEQERLGLLRPPPWNPEGPWEVGGCFACSERGRRGAGQAGEQVWAAAVLWRPGWVVQAVVEGSAGAAYEPGFLALREGPLLEAAVRALPRLPQVLLVDATGRDHPRRAGLALHLGAVLGIPTVGVTDRPLVAVGPLPEDRRGARSPLFLEGELVGYWVRTRAGVRPVCAHAAWRTDPEVAALVVLRLVTRHRTPEPLRAARAAARAARARSLPP